LPSRGGAGVTLTTAAGDGIDLFIAAYETTGALRWVRQVPGPAQVDSHGLAMLADGDSRSAAPSRRRSRRPIPPRAAPWSVRVRRARRRWWGRTSTCSWPGTTATAG